MTEKQTPAAERQRETKTRWPAPFRLGVLDNRPDTGLVPGRESALTRSGGPVKRKTTMTPEPKDKLDAAPTMVGEANGLEDATPDWHAVDWRTCEASVRRLRQRIFTAS
jgi:hypothetical protein